MTIVQVGKGNGGSGDGGSDLLRLEPPSELRPAPSPLSDASATLQSDNNDTFSGGETLRLLFLPFFFSLNAFEYYLPLRYLLLIYYVESKE